VATSTTYNGLNAPPVAAVAQIVQVNAARQKDVLGMEQAGLVTTKSMAWWHVPTKATVDVVNSVDQVTVCGKVNQLATIMWLRHRRAKRLTKSNKSRTI